ncbi:MAG: hypothetical protein ACTHKK_04095 [Candidatus Nitrosocosmicus sp.]
MSKKSSSSSSNITSDNTVDVKDTGFSYNTNIQNNNQQDFTDSLKS